MDEEAQYMVLDYDDMNRLEQIAARIVAARGREYSYHTKAGVKVTFTPPTNNTEETT